MGKIGHTILDVGGVADPGDVQRIAHIRLAQRRAREAAIAAGAASQERSMLHPDPKFSALNTLLAPRHKKPAASGSVLARAAGKKP